MNRVKIFLTITSFLTFLFLGLYFFQVHKLINNSYLLSKNQKEILKLQSQNLAFSQQTASSGYFSQFEKSAMNLNFVKNDNIKYIPLVNDYLVRK